MSERGDSFTSCFPFKTFDIFSLHRLKAEADAAKAEADKKKAEKKAKKKKAKEAAEGEAATEEKVAGEEGESAPPTEAPPTGSCLAYILMVLFDIGNSRNYYWRRLFISPVHIGTCCRKGILTKSMFGFY